MQNTKRFILSGCLAASLIAGVTGCNTEDRSAGRYMDDKLIARRIESNLNRDPVYKFPDVKINVFDGVAQLSGFVDSRQQLRIAAERTSRVEGVREVINDIAMKPEFKLVPAAQSNRDRESNTGATGNAYGENSGSYHEQHAPIITPDQSSPATPSSKGRNSDKDNNSDYKNNQ